MTSPDRSNAGTNRPMRSSLLPSPPIVSAQISDSTESGRDLLTGDDAAITTKLQTLLGLGALAEGDDAGDVNVNPAGWSGFLNGCPATTVQGVFDWIDANK